MWQNAMWLGVPRLELEKWNILEGDLTGRFAYFRYDFFLDEKATLIVDVTANSRYRLWVNELPVLSGPCKGDLYRHYYETVDLTQYIKPGNNVLAVQVLYSNAYAAVKQTDERAGIFGVLTPGGGHRLALEGNIKNSSGEIIGTVTTGEADWKVYLDGSFYLKSYEVTANLGAICEEPDLRCVPTDWKKQNYSTSEWSTPDILEYAKKDPLVDFAGLVNRFTLKERPIPLLYETETAFKKEIATTKIPASHILEKGRIRIEAHETRKILLDAGRIVNGYPKFIFHNGTGANVVITYFEKFTHESRTIKRDDAKQGTISGITDRLTLNGKETAFEPFWYRTFRFIYIEVETEEEPVELLMPAYRKTGYPLNCISYVKSSESWINQVWEMCVHTLENCMMETYMDCPYYEQMQFPMDTRLQALFTYIVSGDTRMAGKALEDYHCSMTPEGLIHGKYPSAYTQIISTFSLHYIYMLLEYCRQTGDVWAVRKYFPDMDQILDYYDRKVGSDGLVGRLGYWEFVDWQPAWEEYGGAPAALQQGPSTIINLMYAYALECAARLNEMAGRTGMGEEYRIRKAKILQEIQRQCWDEEQEMYREGPDYKQYTCHAQAWAVLTGLLEGEGAKKALKHAAEREDVLKCSFSTSYEWFRACEIAGVYDYTKTDMKKWADLLELGCTCCPETPGNTRSDCHAWSALPMYEMICCMAGIRMEDGNRSRVRIEPHMDGIRELEGQAVTAKGNVEFAYQQVSDTVNGRKSWNYRITLPEGLDGEFIDPSGNAVELYGGQQYDFVK